MDFSWGEGQNAILQTSPKSSGHAFDFRRFCGGGGEDWGENPGCMLKKVLLYNSRDN